MDYEYTVLIFLSTLDYLVCITLSSHIKMLITKISFYNKRSLPSYYQMNIS